jgi:hypothetical protein
MSTKKIILVGLAAALVVVVVMFSRQPEENRAQNVSSGEPTNIVIAAAPSDVQPVETSVEESKPVVVEDKRVQVPVAQKKVSTNRSGKPAKQKPPVQDPDARVALSMVGADPEAEAYWIGAINDPDLPADERKNLIEDLNEDGLSDPKHPGPEDMPLILNRIQLIEELAPNAMDQDNAAAFAEAYKDLVNLANGQPVN